ncbi:Calmodulin-binding domain [Parasponia andersonii]|uniref:Calmodulin-binding domain n=1 Tax=Parasponia andersonii TaxID=3476 RepID=A0A2P5AIR8_PARAD|nr:Calmodulin-binding domain [Parasponia andersonii]
MVTEKFEAGTDFCDVNNESDQVSVTVESTLSVEQDNKSREGPQVKNNNKLKKLRSIKLSKSPTLKPSKRRSKSQLRNILVELFSDIETSPRSTSSHLSRFSRKSAPPITRRSSFKSGKTLTRMSSKKLKKPLMKKSLGGSDINQMKISRSTSLVNFDGSIPARRGNKSELDQSYVEVEASPHSSKSINGSGVTKMSLQQATPHTPESGYSRVDGKRKTSVYSKPKSLSPGQKSSSRTLTRKASLKPLRASTKMAGAKSKRGSLMKHDEISQVSDLSVERATCSSTLKDSKFPDTLQLQQGGSETDGISVMKFCTFSYCSLHGHRHAKADVPPLKRLISMRRRSLKNKKRFSLENRSICREKHSGKAMKDPISLLVQEVDRDLSLDLDKEQEAARSSGLGGYGEEDAKANGSLSPAERVEISSLECCSANTELNRSVSETSDKEEAGTTATKTDEDYNNDSESVGKNIERNDTATGKAHDEMSKPDDSSFISPSKLQNEQTAAKEEKENLDPDDGFFQFPPSTDSELNVTNNGTPRMQLKDQKYVRMWRLMYKHAVKGVAGSGTVENQVPPDRVDKTEQVEEAEVVLESNDSESCQGLTESDQATPVERANAGRQQMELYQNDAVKLVQEAFNEILLPEIQELSSDDRSVSSSVSSGQELFEQGHVDGTSSLKEEKTSSKVGAKSEQKVSKSWSSLKKIIVLKRFVKALEKVKKISRREPRYLPLQPDPEAEQVNLRHQTAEERKNAEEWMLDYALQQVISKLAPPQQRRVAMLVKAFETVLPLSDLKSSPSLNSAEATQVHRGQACNSPLVQTDEKTSKETDECADQVSDFLKAEPQDPAGFSKLKDIKQEENVPLSESDDKDRNEGQMPGSTTDNWNNSKVILPMDQPGSFSICLEEIGSHKSCDKLSSNDIVSTSREVLHDENVQVATKQVDVNLSSETCNAGYELCDTKSKNNVISADETLVIPSASINPLEDATAVNKEENERNEEELEFPIESPPIEESGSECTTDVAQDTQLEKQSYMRLWCLVYKHMASGIDAKDGTRLNNDEAKTTQGADLSISSQSFPEKYQDTNMKDDTVDIQKAALRRIEAIKLIEKAIDDILLPENQDNSPDDQSTISDSIRDEEPQEKKFSVKEPLISCSTANESFRESSRKEAEDLRIQENEERASNDVPIAEEQKTSSNQKIPRSWSNLKKMILLKRFIKALEDVRKFTPRGPRFLPLEADPEAEKVNLRHHGADERKSAEEWMLDYALQQAVAKLTPARKRKVQLLVEAFETVSPTIRS